MNLNEAKERMQELIETCNHGIEEHGEYDDLFQKDKEAIETVLNALNNSVSKDKIKEKLSKLEKEFDFYAGRDPYEWEDAEFDGEQCDDIAIKIGVLKELLEG